MYIPDQTYYFQTVGFDVSIAVGIPSEIKMPESYLKMRGVQRFGKLIWTFTERVGMATLEASSVQVRNIDLPVP